MAIYDHRECNSFSKGCSMPNIKAFRPVFMGRRFLKVFAVFKPI